MAGGYTPTIIARNQFVAVSKTKSGSGAADSNNRSSAIVSKVDPETAPQQFSKNVTLNLNETVKLEPS